MSSTPSTLLFTISGTTISAFDAESQEMTYAHLEDGRRAEEAVQGVFTRAWHKAEQFDEESASVRTWLYEIALEAVSEAERSPADTPDPLVEMSDFPLAPRAPSIHGTSPTFAAMQWPGRYRTNNGHHGIKSCDGSAAFDPGCVKTRLRIPKLLSTNSD